MQASRLQAPSQDINKDSKWPRISRLHSQVPGEKMVQLLGDLRTICAARTTKRAAYATIKYAEASSAQEGDWIAHICTMGLAHHGNRSSGYPLCILIMHTVQT